MGTKTGVTEVLANAEKYLNSQINPTPEQIEDVILPNEDVVEVLCSEEEIDTAMKVLASYRKKVEIQIQELTDKIKQRRVIIKSSSFFSKLKIARNRCLNQQHEQT